MYAPEFDYHRANSVAEAIQLLGANDNARLLAGGQSLIPLMKLRLARPSVLIDIGRIAELKGISVENDVIRIGGSTTHQAIASSHEVQHANPMLAEVAGGIGDPAVRNRGTIGGSIAHADPAADYPTVLVALEATINVSGPGGDRAIASGDFFVDLFTTALADGELVVSVEVPVLGEGQGGSYQKHRHPASSYAVVGAAALVTVEDGTASEARIAIGGVTPTPRRAAAAEAALTGNAIDAETITIAASKVGEVLDNPLGDTYASGEYRVYLASVLTRRAIDGAFARATA